MLMVMVAPTQVPTPMRMGSLTSTIRTAAALHSPHLTPTATASLTSSTGTRTVMGYLTRLSRKAARRLVSRAAMTAMAMELTTPLIGTPGARIHRLLIPTVMACLTSRIRTPTVMGCLTPLRLLTSMVMGSQTCFLAELIQTETASTTLSTPMAALASSIQSGEPCRGSICAHAKTLAERALPSCAPLAPSSSVSKTLRRGPGDAEALISQST